MTVVSENLKIEIRPIPNRNGIRDFSDNLEFFSQAHVIHPFVNPVTRKYSTGLTKEDKTYLEEKGFPFDISDDYIQNIPHEFWESPAVKVELTNSPIFLYPGKSLIDFIKYKYLLVNNYIYTSEEEMLTGSKPEATHFIYDESDALALKATKIVRQNALISKIRELSLSRKRDIILILLNENTDNKNEDYLTVRFDDIVSDKNLMVQLEELLERPDEDVKLSADIKTAIQKNVLRRTQKGIFYFETNLGYSENEVKEYLLKDENQELYLTIKAKI